MSINNTWLTPLQRSYQTIKNQLIDKLRAKVPEITDYSEGNIFIILISMFSAIAEVIHYYNDNHARETFFVTARRFDSLHKHGKLVDYHIKSANPASVDLTLYRASGTPITSDIAIPAGTSFTSKDGKNWVSTKTVIWKIGQYVCKVPIEQSEKRYIDLTEIGTVTGTIQIQITGIPNNKLYAEGSMVLTINDVPWTLVETFAYYKSSDLVYKVELDYQSIPYIVFGNGLYGATPPINGVIKANYSITTGVAGNSVDKDQFYTVPTFISEIQSDVRMINTTRATGGSNYETFDMLKEHIPLSIKTLGVAVTREDWEAIARLCPGVDKAYVNYICGRFVEIYITPDGGGIASQTLLDNTMTYLLKRKVITTSISVKPTTLTTIYLSAMVTGKQSFRAVDIINQVKRTLIDNYNQDSSNINKPIRLSDLYATIDNLSMVSHLTITKLFLKPYIINVENIPGQPDLALTNYNQTSFIGDGTEMFIVTILSSTNYKIIASGNPDVIMTGTFGTSMEVQGLKTTFQITLDGSLNYPEDATYKLITQPMDKDIIPYGYSIPVFDINSITLIINETV